MLRFNCCFILVLIVTTITTTSAEKKETCNLIDEMMKPMCKVLKSFYTQDNGQLGTVTCDCVTAFYKSDLSYCHTKDYNFTAAPLCGEHFKSNEFANAVKITDNFVTEFTKLLFRDGFHVCTETNEEKLFTDASQVFEPGFISDFYFFVFKNAFPAKTADKFIHCYKELIDLSPKHTKD